MQHIDLLSLSARDYVFRQAHPALQRLQLNLALFIVQHFSEYLDPEVTAKIGLSLLDFVLTDLYVLNSCENAPRSESTLARNRLWKISS